MEYLGQPFEIQNTTEGWQVTWNNAITIRSAEGELKETISFTVLIPRRAELTIGEVQNFALKRAQELLQDLIRRREQKTGGDQ